MFGDYKFVRTKNGKTSFAKIAVISTPNSAWQISWSPELPNYFSSEYDSAIRQAIEFISDEHKKRNGTPRNIEMNLFEDSVVDTNLDAVMCAAAMAIWKSLGYLESEIEFIFDERWQPTFKFP